MVVHADGHVGHDLIEGRGKGTQAGDPVVVVFYLGETELFYQLGEVGENSAHLVDGHLPGFEFRAFLVVGDLTHKQFAADFFVVGEPGGVDGGGAHQESLLPRQLFIEGSYGVVGDLVVISLVSENGGKFRGVLKSIFPEVVEHRVEGLAAIFQCNGWGSEFLRTGRGSNGQKEKCDSKGRESWCAQRGVP